MEGTNAAKALAELGEPGQGRLIQALQERRIPDPIVAYVARTRLRVKGIEVRPDTIH